MTVRGVDISIIQGNVDFTALAASGVQFVVIRCGVGNGGIVRDYTQNVTRAKAAGLKVMAYHFIYPLPPLASQPMRDPIKQAQYHFNAVQGEMASIDCEWPAPQDFAKWNCNPAQLNQWMLAYLTEYTRLDNGRKPLVYTYPYWAAAVKFDQQFAQYPLWIASYQATPAIPHPWTDWVMWQTTGGGGHLPGGAPVDTDVAKDLSLWDPPADPAAPPDPVIVAQPDPPSPPLAPPAHPPASPVIPALSNPLAGIVDSVLNWFKRV
jgi:lysozyme